MKGLKFIIGFAVFGFLLSLFSGFAGVGNSFGRILCNALIFSLVFAVLAFLINFIANKFLVTDSDSSGDLSQGTQYAPSAPSSAHSVDIVVQDEELPADENPSQFVVGPTRQMLAPGDVADVKKADSGSDTVSQMSSVSELSAAQSVENAVKAANVSGSASGIPSNNVNNGFVPVSLGETPMNVSSVEAKSQNDIIKEEKASAASQAAGEDADDGELDSLPDLEDLSGYTSTQGSMSSQSDVPAEEGYSESSSSSAGSISAEEVTDGKDAELMAKAISTLLAKE